MKVASRLRQPLSSNRRDSGSANGDDDHVDDSARNENEAMGGAVGGTDDGEHVEF